MNHDKQNAAREHDTEGLRARLSRWWVEATRCEHERAGICSKGRYCLNCGEWLPEHDGSLRIDRDEVGLLIDAVAMQVQDRSENPYRPLLHKLQEAYSRGR